MNYESIREWCQKFGQQYANQLRHYRPLGAEEQLYWLHDQAYPLHFALTAQIKGKFSVDRLQQALTLVQHRHPLLRVRIALDEAEPP